METIESFGQIAGIGGIGLGVLLFIFRDIVRKKIFANLTKEQSFRLLRLITVLTWSIAALGIVAWVWGGSIGGVVAKNGVAAGGNIKVGGEITIDGKANPNDPDSTDNGSGSVTAIGGVAAGGDIDAGNIKIEGGN